MTSYGYIRVSTEEQNVERQINKMLGLGISENNLYIDHASGKNMDRQNWQKLKSIIERGDVLFIDSLDRLGRSYELVTREWKELTKNRGVDIRTLDLDIFDSIKFREMGDIGHVIEDMLLSLLSYVAETERKKILSRQAEGIAIAKKRGVYKGKQKKEFSELAIKEATQKVKDGDKKAAANSLGVSVQTIYNMLADGRLVV